MQGIVVDEQFIFSWTDLCRATGADADQLRELVDEGVLQPSGAGPADWQFGGPSLQRARTALRLAADLELGLAGAALVMDLLAEIETLRARLR